MSTPTPAGPEPAATGPLAVYAALLRAIQGGDVDLAVAARTEPELAGLLPALAALRVAVTFPLTGAEVSENGGTVLLTGAGSFGLPEAAPEHIVPITARMTYAAPDDRDRFDLALGLPAGWKFSTTFANLPQTQTVQPGGAVYYTESFLIGLPLADAVLSAVAVTGLETVPRLAGRLYPEGALAAYADFFAPWPLVLDGPVTLPESAAAAPAMDLVGRSGRPPIGIPPVALDDFALGLRCHVDLDPEEEGVEAVSVLDGLATLRLGGSEQAVGLATVTLLATASMWRFQVDFQDEEPLRGEVPPGLTAIASILGMEPGYLTAVPGLREVAGFRVSDMEVTMIPPGRPGGPALSSVGVTFLADREWHPPVPYLRITGVGMRWLAVWGDSVLPDTVSGCFFGVTEFWDEDLGRTVTGELPPRALERPAVKAGTGTAAAPPVRIGAAGLHSASDPAVAPEPVFSLELSATFPGWSIGGLLVEGEIPLDTALLAFFGVAGPDSGLAITDLSFDADPTAQTFQAQAFVTTDYVVPLLGDVSLALHGVRLSVDVSRSAVNGGIEGDFTLIGGAPSDPPGLPEPTFRLGARYSNAKTPELGTGGATGATGAATEPDWTFTGALYPDSYVDLIRLVAEFAGTEPADWVPSLSLEALDLSFSTGSQAYSVAGTAAFRWTLQPFGGSPLAVSADAEVAVSRAAADEPVDARLAGVFAVDKLALSAEVNLTAGQPTYQFSVAFGDVWVSAVTGWRPGPGPDDPQHQVVTFQAGGVTLGAVLEYLVGLAAPTLGFQLAPPWNLLGRIELDRFAVTVDPTDGSVDVTYGSGASVPGMTVSSVGVRMRRTRGRPAVELILTGEFLDRTYPDEKPLSWDVLSSDGPAVPGGGSQLLDLRYLGLGQRIALTGAPPATVRDAVDRLSRGMPPARAGTNPLAGDAAPGIRFAADAGWLIGLDASVAEVLDLAVVFDDPRLYGLSVGLRGERAGSLAGLAFEILYKKISDDVGVFRVELRLPDAFRRIELGAVAITLGLVVVEVYTNGDFLVDLGFPHDRDFSRSFSVEVFPFLGRGGVYFGVLDGTTTSRVPAITNGTFSPVLALGVGLSVGVGKEFRSGPLSGGAYVELVAVFEGVFAWFNPTGSGTAPAQYYRAQATVALHGKVYGTVDFKVLKVSVVIEAWASATLTLESYRATQVRLAASVRVSASIKVLFVRVRFSFSASIDLGFTLGADRATPWILGPAQTPGMTPARRPDLLARAQYAAHLANRHSAGVEAGDWDPSRPVFPDQQAAKVPLILLPVFAADGIPVLWDTSGSVATTPARAGGPGHRVAFTLFAESDVEDPAASAATVLLDGLLRYALSAVAGAPYGPAAVVTAGQLELLADELAAPQPPDGPFSLAAMAEFFAVNLHLELSGDPDDTAGDPARFPGTAVPLPPFLSWTSPQLGDRDLGAVNPVGPLYAWGAARYAEQFSPVPPVPAPPPPDHPDEYEPFGGYLFGDWCLMVAKTGVQAAADALAAWTVDVTGPTTPADLADRFPTGAAGYAVRIGDTLDSVAAALGATPTELAFLNPGLAAELAASPVGRILTVEVGVSPDEVAADNAAEPLAAGVYPLGRVDYQAAVGDTLDGIAVRFALPQTSDLFAGGLADDTALLRTGAEFGVAAVTQPMADTALIAAATYFTHYRAPLDVAYTDWYAQAVFDLNSLDIDGGAAATIPPGLELQVPTALYGDESTSYWTVSGDTLPLIGTALSLAQNYGAGTDGPAGWPDFRDATVGDPAGGTVLIPAASIVVLAGESVAMLGRRTVVHAGSLTGLLDWIGGVPVLAPLAVLPVPAARVAVDAGETLAGLSARTGLALTDLARRLADTPIYTGTDEAPLRLTVRHLPLQGVDELVRAVTAPAAAADVIGSSSRQLMSGLRLPGPVYGPLDPADPTVHATATGPLQPLYALTGQQAAGPAPDPDHPADVGLEVAFTVHPDAPWITLTGSEVTGPATTAGDPLPGRIRRTGPVDALVFRYTNAELAAEYPALTLTMPAGAAPQPLPSADTVPVGYGLDHRIAVQSAVPLPLPPPDGVPLTGTATVWPFPSRLLARARSGGTGLYDVVRAATRAGQPADIVPGSTFGTLLTFRLRRTGDSRHVYELLGADTTNRQLALALFRYLTADPEHAAGTVLRLTAAPAPDAPDTAGQAVLDAVPTLTYLLRTNQSTQSVAPGTAAARAAAGFGPDAADLTDAAGFSLLLWEGSVVGGSGYHFGFETADGGGLPAGLFDSRGEARLGLLAVLGARREPAPAGRALLPVDTCALAGPGLDPEVGALFVESADGMETTVEPAMPQGTVGVRLAVPDPGEGEAPDEVTRRLFSLATYAVPDDGRFAMERSGLPAGPQVDDGLGLPLWLRERREMWARAGRALPEVGQAQAVWRYEQAFPIARYAVEQPAPAVPGLPDPAADPYRGVSGDDLPEARVDVGFADVLGNVTATPEATR